MNDIIIFFAETFPYFVVVLAAIFLLFHKDVSFKGMQVATLIQRLREVVIVSFVCLFAWYFSYLLKAVFHTARPLVTEPLFFADGYGFPSFHAAFFFALAMSLTFYHKKIGAVFFIFATLISLARVLGGVHSILDIFGGFALGSLISYFFYKIFK